MSNDFEFQIELLRESIEDLEEEIDDLEEYAFDTRVESEMEKPAGFPNLIWWVRSWLLYKHYVGISIRAERKERELVSKEFELQAALSIKEITETKW